MSDDLLTPAEVCGQYLGGIHTFTLNKWVRCGRFPAPIEFGPRKRRWQRTTVQAWLDARAHEAEARDRGEPLPEPRKRRAAAAMGEPLRSPPPDSEADRLAAAELLRVDRKRREDAAKADRLWAAAFSREADRRAVLLRTIAIL